VRKLGSWYHSTRNRAVSRPDVTAGYHSCKVKIVKKIVKKT
jgi:hypothetical protein